MKRIITDNSGDRWLCEGRSRNAMLSEIAHARVTGSIGGASYMREPGKPEELVAKVNRIHSDYSPQAPYERLR